MKCPYCQEDIEDDERICEFCGKALIKAGSDSPTTVVKIGQGTGGEPDGLSQTPPEIPIPSETLPEDSVPIDYSTILKTITDGLGTSGDLPPLFDEIKEEIEGELNGDGSVSCEGYSTPPVNSNCVSLVVEYTSNIFFVSGMQTLLKLRITPRRNDVRKVRVWFSPKVFKQEREYHEVDISETEQWRKGTSVILEGVYCPEGSVSGMIPIRILLSCTLSNGHTEHFRLDSDHKCFPKDMDVGQVINQITVTGSNAVEINNKLTDLADQNPKRKIESLLDEMNDILRNFNSVSLKTDSSWTRVYSIAAAQIEQCDRLTMEMDGKLYHLLWGNELKFGRDPSKNDIVVADMLQGRTLADCPNSTVSRKHMQLHYCGDSINVFDTSSGGTFINGCKPVERGSVLPDEADIRFGEGIIWSMRLLKCKPDDNTIQCRNCPRKKISGVLFTRKDEVPEQYLLLWECGHFASRNFSGCVFVRKNGGFLLVSEDKRYYPLNQNTKICVNGREIRMRKYCAYGFDPETLG